MLCTRGCMKTPLYDYLHDQDTHTHTEREPYIHVYITSRSRFRPTFVFDSGAEIATAFDE
jgi:hypothetical protein